MREVVGLGHTDFQTQARAYVPSRYGINVSHINKLSLDTCIPNTTLDYNTNHQFEGINHRRSQRRCTAILLYKNCIHLPHLTRFVDIVKAMPSQQALLLLQDLLFICFFICFLLGHELALLLELSLSDRHVHTEARPELTAIHDRESKLDRGLK